MMMMSFDWKDRRRRELLPIDGRLGEILGLLAEHQVVIAEAETGAGKTTRIGQAIVVSDPRARVRMTLPRRNAVRWNGKRIAEEMGQRPGRTVGWRLSREEPVASGETRLILQVDQALSNEIRRRDGRLPKGVLIVDEAHERSVSTDVLLGLIKRRLSESPETRVLITSATIDTKKFSEFFGGAPVVSVSGRCHPVSTEVVRLTHAEHHSQAAARAAGMVMERFLKGELTIPTPDGQGKQLVTQGTVIGLLPGKEDIAQAIRHLEWQAEKLEASDRFEILSCHGESSPEEQDAIQSPLAPGKLRFVCGTEILRSSVTVRHTVGVVDSLQLKRLITDEKGVAHLTKVAISKAEADQAKGRAGRTQPGFYMPVSYQTEYENLQPYPVPAILREPLTHVTLQVAAVGASVRDFEFIDAPDPARVEVAITRLKRLGALDEAENITGLGELLLQFPLDPERAKALITADQLGILAEAVVATATLEVEGIFFRPREPRESFVADEAIVRLILARCEKRYGSWEQAHEARDSASVDLSELPEWIARKSNLYEVQCGNDDFPHREGRRWVSDLIRAAWAGVSKSDFVALVRAYRAFKGEERRLKTLVREDDDFSRNQAERELRNWCDRWGINFKRIRMAEEVMWEIREELASSPLRMENGLTHEREFDAEALTKALASGMTDHIARNENGFTGPLGTFELSYQSACPKGCELVMVGGVRKIPVNARRGGTSFIHLADIAAPVKAEWLSEVMPQLCTRTRQGDHRYDATLDAVMETEVEMFIGLEIRRYTVTTADDEAAVKTFCAWIAGQMVVSSYCCVVSGPLEAVVTANLERQKQAMALNIRAGENIFPVLDRKSLETWLAERLAGARCVKGIPNIEALRMPSLEQDTVDRVLLENPDQIELLGQTYKVTYRSGDTPSITLACKTEGPHTWKDLPDAGVKLPGGRLVSVSVQIDWNSRANGTDVPKLKEQVRQYLNQKLWDSWTFKPTITLPDPDDEQSAVPNITTTEYGQCVMEGTPLFAYGTVGLKSSRYHAPDIWFEDKWFRVLEEAEIEREKAVVKLKELKQQARDAKVLNLVKAEAETANARLSEAYSAHHYSGGLSQGLKGRMYRCYHAGLPSTVAELRQFTCETNALLAEVEQELAEAKRAVRLREKLGSVLREHYAECPFCKQPVERELGTADSRDGTAYCDCLGSRDSEGSKQAVAAFEAQTMEPTAFFEGCEAFVVRQTTLGEAVVAELLAFYKWGSWNLYFRAQPDAIRSGGELVTETLWQMPSELELKLAELKKARATYAEEVERAEQDLADGYTFKLRFRVGKNPKTGEEQLEAGGRGVKYILDRRTRLRVKPERAYYCRERNRLVDTPTFKLIAVEAYLPVERELEAEIAALEAEINGEELVDEVYEEETVEEEASEGGEDMDAMLEALKARFNTR